MLGNIICGFFENPDSQIVIRVKGMLNLIGTSVTLGVYIQPAYIKASVAKRVG